MVVLSGINIAHNNPTGLKCHNPEISARAEMMATTEASHPRTARVHPKNVSHNVVISARVGVVFSTWTGVCLSVRCAVRESHSYPLSGTQPGSPSIARSSESARVGWRSVCAPRSWPVMPARRSLVYPRNGRKKARISAASASGCSSAAKWPPRSMGVQRWRLNTRSAIERGGRTISRGKSL